MQKPVRAVIAAARAQIGVMSQAKLPDENMRLILNQVVSDYENHRVMEQDDRFLHRVSAILTPSGDEFIVSFLDSTGASVTDFMPQYLYYSSPSDPNDTVNKVYLSNLDNYSRDSVEKAFRYGQATAAFYGNTYDGGSMKIRMNLSAASVAALTWELVYKSNTDKVLGYNDTVPFPSQHTGLLETALAMRSLDIVDDSSPEWDRKYNRLKNSLNMLLMEQFTLYKKWVDGEPKTRTRALPQYDYRPGRGRRQYPVEGD